MAGASQGLRTNGLVIRPRDPRPADPVRGERLLAGEFMFSGEAIDVGAGGDPWGRRAPSRRFAAALHGFDWAPDLLALGEAGARETLRLWLEWRRAFGRPFLVGFPAVFDPAFGSEAQARIAAQN